MRVFLSPIFLPSLALAFAPIIQTSLPVTLSSSTLLYSTQNGISKTIQTPGAGPLVQFGDIATVKYSCYVQGQSKPFAKSSYQNVMIGDGNMILGWEDALQTMNVGERALVRLTDPNLAYGASGVPPLIPPDAIIELDVQVLDATQAAVDFDSLATMQDKTPRTASAIQAAFEAKQAAKVGIVKKEGWEGWIEKAQSYYFFGLFEGETGEKAPWFLRPSITFPLAFAIVGAAFYVSYKGGAIQERGAQIKDELDEIILSYNLPAGTSTVLALMAMMVASGVELGL
jgi:hypothetical protein